MRIDAHQHYWKLSRGDYGWLTPELPTLYKDFLPDDLSEQLKLQGIDKTIVVQASATIEETVFLLNLCEQHESIAGVVGWLDFAAEDFQLRFYSFHKNPRFIGIRLILQDIDAAEFIQRPNVIENLIYLAKQDFPLDLLFKANQFPTIIKLLELVPTLHAVIDHIGKPQVSKKEQVPWYGYIAEAAKYPNVYCKLSGMVTEANLTNWQKTDFSFYISHVIKSFGMKRVMFGSDWPVCLLAASYSQVVDILLHNLPDSITDSQKDDIFGNNALRFYRLNNILRT